MSGKKKKTNKEPRLSDAFAELENIVQEFEEGDVDLEMSIEKFKKGLTLSKYLKKRLNEIENEIIEIKDDFEEAENEQTDPEDVKEVVGSDNDSGDSQEEIPF